MVDYIVRNFGLRGRTYITILLWSCSTDLIEDNPPSVISSGQLYFMFQATLHRRLQAGSSIQYNTGNTIAIHVAMFPALSFFHSFLFFLIDKVLRNHYRTSSFQKATLQQGDPKREVASCPSPEFFFN